MNAELREIKIDDWVARYSGGDASAGDQLTEVIYPVLSRRLRQLGLPEEDVEDVAQQCALQILRRMPDFESDVGELRHWIAGFARQAARSWYRSDYRRRVKEVSLEDLPTLESDTREDIHDREALVQALGNLPIMDRELLTLRFTLGMTSEEIAQRTNMNAAQVRKRLSRAIEKLRKDPHIRAFLVAVPSG